MLIKSPRGWEIPERLATPEALVLDRRSLVKGLGAIAASAVVVPGARAEADPTAGLYPVKRNETFKLNRPITPEKINSKYNNFYEFGSHKQISRAAQALPIRPWEIKIDGLVEKPFTIGIDDLLKKVNLGRAALPPSLRRGLVDDRAVVRISDA